MEARWDAVVAIVSGFGAASLPSHRARERSVRGFGGLGGGSRVAVVRWETAGRWWWELPWWDVVVAIVCGGAATSVGREGRKMPETTLKKRTLVVSGAGPVGSFLALRLARAHREQAKNENENNDEKEGTGAKVILLERRADHRGAGNASAAELRSINLALSERGRAALRSVGLEDAVLAGAVPMRGRAVHGPNAGADVTGYQPYDDVYGTKCIFSVSRRAINDVLLAAAEADPDVVVRFETEVGKVVPVPPDSESTHQGVTIHLAKSSSETIQADALFGCDGAHSAVREALGRLTPTDVHRTYISHGYVELHVPPTASGEYALKPHDALHIWPRESSMMIALPNPDKSFTATLFAPYDELKAVDGSDEAFWAYFRSRFADVVPLLDLGARGKAFTLFSATVRPWVFRGAVALAGDAAHTQVPFFGQGMNAGLEDVLVLMDLLEKHELALEPALSEYDATRRPCGDAVTELSRANYEHMHTHAASRLFRAWKRIEGTVARVTGLRYAPLYYAVAFTRTPYDVVLRREHFRDAFPGHVSLGLGLVAALAGAFACGRFSSFGTSVSRPP